MTIHNEEDGRRWRKRYEEGATLEDLAKASGVSRNSVRYWILKTGGTMRPVGHGTPHLPRASARGVSTKPAGKRRHRAS